LNMTIVALSAAGVLSSCTALPSSGPDSGQIDQQAAMKVVDTRSSKSRKPAIDYALVDISAAVIANIAQASTPSLRGSFGDEQRGPPNLMLGVGDVISVTVFESQSGGLFIPADAGSRSGNFVTMPTQTIDRGGTITVPYAGRVNVSGRSINDVQAELQSLFSNRAIEPQVVISKVQSRSAQVAVLGDVARPAKLQLTEAGDRVLDMVSQAGGLSTPGVETYVTLQRGSRTVTVLYKHLINTPTENIFVRPGDTIIVNRERRTFLAFGAALEPGRIDFDDANLTLGDALAKAGGLIDSRADPEQVLLYRVVDKAFLKNVKVDVSHYAGDKVPVVFRANLRDPSSLFLLQKFPMQDRDIVYITNSKVTEMVKFLDAIQAVSSTAAGVSQDIVRVRSPSRGL
jgi:polysaccharide export outer membrane protein